RWDLFWVCVAWLSAMAAQCCLTVAVRFGIGNHITNLSPLNITKAVKWAWVAQLIAIFAIGFGKNAVIALLLRIQGQTHRRGAWFLHFIWASNMAINVAQVVLLLYQCEPVAKLWDDNLQGVCDGRTRAEYSGFFQGSWSAASDLVLAIYPITVFWNLKVSWKRKFGLCALMGGGVLASAAGVLKTVFISQAPLTADVTYSLHSLVIAAFTETWLIIILGSIPPLRVYFARVYYQTRTVISGGSANSKTGRGEGSQVQLSILRYSGSRDVKRTQQNTFVQQDNESVERILSEDQEAAPAKIVMRRDYYVAYDKPN
ncbi:hypothetical protein M433DRAFT_67749, partial [Acidomyces richmondensis BFW]